jgi:ABC-type Fe3+-hydroxamate transport system substrate-binding protein
MGVSRIFGGAQAVAMRAVVIGATGGIGAALAGILTARGEVIRVARAVTPGRDLLNEASIAGRGGGAWAPEVLVVMPCIFGMAKAFEDAQRLVDYPGRSRMPTVSSGQVYIADVNAYFVRPGPRVVDGTERLAHLIHPGLFAWTGKPDAFRRLETPSAPQALVGAG